jgi:hypothetical protein
MAPGILYDPLALCTPIWAMLNMLPQPYDIAWAIAMTGISSTADAKAIATIPGFTYLTKIKATRVFKRAAHDLY